jgi:hypothetical protein
MFGSAVLIYFVSEGDSVWLKGLVIFTSIILYHFLFVPSGIFPLLLYEISLQTDLKHN